MEDAQVHAFLTYVLYRGEWRALGTGHADLGESVPDSHRVGGCLVPDSVWSLERSEIPLAVPGINRGKK